MGGLDDWSGERRCCNKMESVSSCLCCQSGTPYKGGKFRLSVSFGADYPFKPPTVGGGAPCSSIDVRQLSPLPSKILFKQKMYHPNVDSDGK